MTLRIILVGLVASLGFELPGSGDVSSWTKASQDWVVSQVAGPSDSVDEATPCLSSVTDCHQVDPSVKTPVRVEDSKPSTDLAFEVISEGMATDFTADVLASRLEEPVAEIVVSLNVGLPDGEEVAIDFVPTSEEIPVVETPSRAERLSSAMQLTIEAVEAWATVIHDGSDQTDATR